MDFLVCSVNLGNPDVRKEALLSNLMRLSKEHSASRDGSLLCPCFCGKFTRKTRSPVPAPDLLPARTSGKNLLFSLEQKGPGILTWSFPLSGIFGLVLQSPPSVQCSAASFGLDHSQIAPTGKGRSKASFLSSLCLYWSGLHKNLPHMQHWWLGNMELCPFCICNTFPHSLDLFPDNVVT